MYQKLYLVIIIVLSSLILPKTSFGDKWTAGKPNPLDKQYTPSGLAKSVGENSGSSNSSLDYKNSIQWNASLVARNIVAFQYQRYLGQSIAIYGGIGFTIGRDRIYNFFNPDSINSPSDNSLTFYSNNDILLPGYISNNEKYKTRFPGYYYAAGIKFINTSGWADNTQYVELGIKKWSQPFELNNRLDGYSTLGEGESKNLRITHTTFSLNYGVIFEGNGGRLQHEIYNGFAIRLTKSDKFYIEEDPVNLGNEIYRRQVENGENQRMVGVGYMYTFGYILGFGF